ncbi:FAD-dependent oxidoreductase [Cellulosimicrobium sp. CpK407]|uniref:glycerol-3-phosphate dehydrogenase/oxidase n=1 Tax=Cellulosimicrobium sp. CpK407 TaxID=3229847 RepID=UPI003F2E6652
MGGTPRADAPRLDSKTYDMVIVGAGINGAAIARDAALRGLDVALVERGDYGGETSSWNSRLIHGGLRYLEHGELRLVHESLHDREHLWHVAPHLVTPLPFVVPLYRHNHVPGWMLRVGMVLYDGLSLRKSVPRHRAMTRDATHLELPGLGLDGLDGAVRYYDGQVVYPERLVLETVLDACRHGADVLNHAEVTEILVEDGAARGVRVHDAESDEELVVRGRCVVNAAGPWVDHLAHGLPLPRQIGGTKGTHLVVDPFRGAPDAAIYFEARSDNRAILVIPWNGRYLIGTTDDRYDGDPGAARGTREEVDYLLAETNALVPSAGLTVDDVLLTYSGVRPLPHRPGAKPGAIPRSHLVETHVEVPRLVSVVGGKLTPHLSLGREVVDKVARLLSLDVLASTAADTPLPGAPSTGSWEDERGRVLADLPFPAEVAERLVRVYGAVAREIGESARRDPRLVQVLGEGRGAVTLAELAHVVEREHATTLTDVLQRRTMVGIEPGLGLDVAEDVADVLGDMLGWDAERRDAEVAAHRTYVRRLLGGTAADDDADETPASAAHAA